MKRALFILSLIASTIVANAQQNPIDSKSDPCSKSKSSSCVTPRQTPAQQAKLEMKNGIRDIKLDTPKSFYNDLIEMENHGYDEIIQAIESGKNFSFTDDPELLAFDYKSVRVMKRSNENLIFEKKIRAYSIRYLFLENNLVGIYIYFNEAYGFWQLTELLTKLYGEPMVEFADRKTWFANTFKMIADSEFKDEFGGEIYILKNGIPEFHGNHNMMNK